MAAIGAQFVAGHEGAIRLAAFLLVLGAMAACEVLAPGHTPGATKTPRQRTRCRMNMPWERL